MHPALRSAWACSYCSPPRLPLPGFVVSRSSSGQDNEKKACRTAATAISAGPTTPGLTRFGFPPQEPRLIDPSTAVSAPLARVSREPRGTFHLPTRMRATTNMHSCGRRRQRLVRWRDYRLDSRPTRRPCSPHATVHRPPSTVLPEVPCLFWTRITTSLLLLADESMAAIFPPEGWLQHRWPAVTHLALSHMTNCFCSIHAVGMTRWPLIGGVEPTA